MLTIPLSEVTDIKVSVRDYTTLSLALSIELQQRLINALHKAKFSGSYIHTGRFNMYYKEGYRDPAAKLREWICLEIKEHQGFDLHAEAKAEHCNDKNVAAALRHFIRIEVTADA